MKKDEKKRRTNKQTNGTQKNDSVSDNLKAQSKGSELATIKELLCRICRMQFIFLFINNVLFVVAIVMV
jgi:hypothetical protein